MPDQKVLLSLFGPDSDGWKETVRRVFCDRKILIEDIKSWETEDYTSSEEDLNYNHLISKDLDSLHSSDVILIYFKEGYKNRFPFFSLGYFCNNDNLVILCSEDFSKRGIVQMICTRKNIPLFYTLEGAIGGCASKLNQKKFLLKK